MPKVHVATNDLGHVGCRLEPLFLGVYMGRWYTFSPCISTMRKSDVDNQIWCRLTFSSVYKEIEWPYHSGEKRRNFQGPATDCAGLRTKENITWEKIPSSEFWKPLLVLSAHFKVIQLIFNLLYVLGGYPKTLLTCRSYSQLFTVLTEKTSSLKEWNIALLQQEWKVSPIWSRRYWSLIIHSATQVVFPPPPPPPRSNRISRIRGHLCSFPVTWTPYIGKKIYPLSYILVLYHWQLQKTLPFPGFLGKSSRDYAPKISPFPRKCEHARGPLMHSSWWGPSKIKSYILLTDRHF